MVGTLRCTLGVLILIFSCVRADAFNGRFGFGHSSSLYSSSMYAAPSYVAPSYWAMPYYCVPSPMIVPVPDAARVPQARPTPAPPSQSAEPPINQGAANAFKAPVIITTHSQTNSPAPLLKDRCRVGFWNLTGRDVTLTVDGKTWTLPRDRATTLDLDRQFTWQTAEQSQRNVIVPDGQATFEVVIR
jgi:hypothetical protein